VTPPLFELHGMGSAGRGCGSESVTLQQPDSESYYLEDTESQLPASTLGFFVVGTAATNSRLLLEARCGERKNVEVKESALLQPQSVRLSTNPPFSDAW
jgi:hypothetical protein